MRGWIRVEAASEALAACRKWRIGEADYAVADTREHSGTLLAKLRGVETREQALALKGAKVLAPRGAMPAAGDGHYYFGDLIGLEVVNEQGERLGTVKQLFSGGAHDVMELEGERQRLLPWVAAVVRKVDLKKKVITVTWQVDW